MISAEDERAGSTSCTPGTELAETIAWVNGGGEEFWFGESGANESTEEEVLIEGLPIVKREAERSELLDDSDGRTWK
jgi:hypothetical protein